MRAALRLALYGTLLSGLLGLVLASPLAASPLQQTDPAPAQAQVTLDPKWLVLRPEDVGPGMVLASTQTRDEGRAVYSELRFEPDYKGLEGPPPTPLLVVDKFWLADDTETARQIFQEQADAGFAEARGAVGSVGPISLPPLGDEARGIGGCGPCDGDVLHFRIVFRYLNGVHAIYSYGDRAYAYQEVAVNLANILNERIRAVPSGPLPDKVWQIGPRDAVLTGADVAREAFSAGEEGGSDDRGSWYWTRFKLTREFESRHVGPLDIYSKVWVAPSIEVAQAIFAEQAQPGFPEAQEEVGVGQFPMEDPPSVGNENFGWSACNEDCNTEFFRYLHHRYLFRSGNVVGLIYIWGGNQDSSVNQVKVYANAMRDRLK